MNKTLGPVISFSNTLKVLAISLATEILLCFLLSRAPFETIYLLLIGPFTSVYSFGNMINGSVILMLGGLGISVALKGGSFNLGGEGQIYLGGFVATIIALAFGSGGKAVVILSILAGTLASGVVAGFSGWCKMRWRTNEMISSYLLSGALILIIDYLITGPFMDLSSNLLTTSKVSLDMRLLKILTPSNLSTAIIIALILVFITSVYLNKTKSGFILKTTGLSYRFAVYSGLNTRFYTWFPMFISGGFHGFAGAISIFGTYYSCLKGFSSGLGWNSFAVALIARTNPIAVIPAALFFSWIESGAKLARQMSDISSEIASIVQAVVFFFITCEVFRTRQKSSIQGGL